MITILTIIILGFTIRFGFDVYDKIFEIPDELNQKLCK